ncbi:MAG: aldo/keto reductase [Halothiobacillaceae bacterium]|nr:aldo/keto reductase [Halothiobacillaceae bacterium]
MKLAIGTAQFGLDYGVSNTSGRTSFEEAARILDRAGLAGIDTLDTAAAYGDSEQVLGRIGLEDWNVVSKVPPLPNDAEDGKEWVLRHVRQSMCLLRVERLDGLLLHSATDLLKPQGGNIAAGLREVKSEGLVGKVGYSIYSPQSLAKLIGVMPPDLVQAPFNVFDQRLARSGWLGRLADLGAEVHVRSVFMQGLLLMGSAERPHAFDKWRELWQRWDAAVGGHGDRALALCLGFVKAQPGISHVIVGVDNQGHLEQLLAIWEKAGSFDADGLSCDDPLLVEPSNWKLK